MVFHMLAILIDRRTFAAFKFYKCDPIFGGFGNRNAFCVRSMNALTNVHVDRGMKSVGLSLFVEGLNVALPALVAIIDQPSFFSLAMPCLPNPFADRH